MRVQVSVTKINIYVYSVYIYMHIEVALVINLRGETAMQLMLASKQNKQAL